MRTRRSPRNQERLYRDIGRQLQAAARASECDCTTDCHEAICREDTCARCEKRNCREARKLRERVRRMYRITPEEGEV